MAYHLQRIVGDRPILLPIDRMALLVGKSTRHVSTRIKLAMRDQYLIPVDLEYSYTKRKARQFRANLTKIEKLCREGSIVVGE